MLTAHWLGRFLELKTPTQSMMFTLMFNTKDHFREWLERKRARSITYTEARKRAGRGAVYLDRMLPGWYRRIDLDTLCLGDGINCILGQLYGSFLEGLSWSLVLESTPYRFAPIRLGFMCVWGVCQALQEQDYEYLNQAWREELQQRAEKERSDVQAWLHDLGVEGITCSVTETAE